MNKSLIHIHSVSHILHRAYPQGGGSLSAILTTLLDTESDASLPSVLLVGQEGAGKAWLVDNLLGRSFRSRNNDRRLARWELPP